MQFLIFVLVVELYEINGMYRENILCLQLAHLIRIIPRHTYQLNSIVNKLNLIPYIKNNEQGVALLNLEYSNHKIPLKHSHCLCH